MRRTILGGIGNKFGSFTEGLAHRSCKRILHQRFALEQTAHGADVPTKPPHVTEFLPQFKGMKIRGLVATVYLPKGMQEQVEAAGLYLATGADENFELVSPSHGFQAAAW